MKKYLITHIDLDGISPIILLKLAGVDFNYKTTELKDLGDFINTFVESDLSEYDTIYVTDLTLTDEMYEKLIALNKQLLVFDHHQTHLYANKYPFVTVSVDLHGRQTCGTELFYEYLKDIYKDLNKENIKEYVKYVRELDTFNFTSDLPKHLDTIKETIGANDFIKTMVKRLSKDKPFALTTFEKRFIKLKTQELERYLQKKEKDMQAFIIDGKKCAVCFAETNKSILGNYISTKYPEYDLVVLIDASSRISYRTARDDIDLCEFVSTYGGGGHRLASGSKFDNEDRINIIKSYFKDVKEIEKN